MSEDIEVSVPIELLEILLYATSAATKIENLVIGAKQDPLFPKAAKIAAAFEALERRAKHARRAATNHAGWNDPLTADEIQTLLQLASRPGTWTITAEDVNKKDGNTIQGLMRRGMVELGTPCNGVKWAGEDRVVWEMINTHFVLRVTPRGHSSAGLLEQQQGSLT